MAERFAYHPASAAVNHRWTRRATDPVWVRVPLHRCFGGYMPAKMRAKDQISFVSNRRRFVERT